MEERLRFGTFLAPLEAGRLATVEAARKHDRERAGRREP